MIVLTLAYVKNYHDCFSLDAKSKFHFVKLTFEISHYVRNFMSNSTKIYLYKKYFKYFPISFSVIRYFSMQFSIYNG